jgi:hypothetical protein
MKIPYPKIIAINLLSRWPAFGIALIFLVGCDKFEGDQTIPSYLKIDSVGFTTNNGIQGTDNQNFVDAWIYVDDDIVGGFEMPFTIPVLSEGKHKLEIVPGVILNGISSTRAPYPVVQPIILNDFNFVIDSVVSSFRSTSYLSNAEFRWMEDFEDASLAILKSPNSDTGIYRTSPAGAPGAFIDEYSEYSGVSYIDSSRPHLQLVSTDGNGEGFVFDRGDYVFLEMNYRTNLPLVVGVYVELLDNTIEERQFLIINPSDDWKKIYVNFTPIVYETVDAVNYKIYLEAQWVDIGTNGMIMLDNIKLITRPNL